VTSRRSELAFHGHSISVEEIDDGLGLLLKGMKLKHEDLPEDGKRNNFARILSH